MAGVGAPRPTATRAPSGPRARRGRGCRYFPGSGRRRRATASREGRARPRRAPQAQPLRGPCTHSHGRTLGRGGGQTRRSAFSARPSAEPQSSRQCRESAWPVPAVPVPRGSGARVSRVMHPRAHVRWYSLALNDTQKYLLTHSQLYIHFLGGLDRFLLSNALPVCSWMT